VANAGELFACINLDDLEPNAGNAINKNRKGSGSDQESRIIPTACVVPCIDHDIAPNEGSKEVLNQNEPMPQTTPKAVLVAIKAVDLNRCRVGTSCNEQGQCCENQVSIFHLHFISINESNPLQFRGCKEGSSSRIVAIKRIAYAKVNGNLAIDWFVGMLGSANSIILDDPYNQTTILSHSPIGCKAPDVP